MDKQQVLDRIELTYRKMLLDYDILKNKSSILSELSEHAKKGEWTPDMERALQAVEGR
jgi:hypothetical protein